MKTLHHADIYVAMNDVEIANSTGYLGKVKGNQVMASLILVVYQAVTAAPVCPSSAQ
jgi:hypothetical protein